MDARSYYIWTIGCQMNKADSERLAGALHGLGFRESASPREAGVIVLNSCVVRQSAKDKVTGMITSLKPLKQRDPERIVALMGCMVGPKTGDLERRYPYVDVFMAPQQYGPLIDLLGERLGMDVEGCLQNLAPRQATRHHLRAHNPRLRRVLLLLHHPIPARQAAEPPGGGRGARGGAFGAARRQGGHPARPDGGRLRPRPAGQAGSGRPPGGGAPH